MGKLLTVKSGYSAVLLPSTNGLRNYSPGDQVTVTDAEYAAFTAETTNAVTVTTSGLPDPARKATDPAALRDTVNTNASGALTLYTGFNEITLTGNVTSVTVAADSPSTGVIGAKPGSASHVAVKLVQDATGSRTVTWGSAFKFAGGTAPVLQTAAGKVDFLRFVTTDGGLTFYETDRSLNIA